MRASMSAVVTDALSSVRARKSEFIHLAVAVAGLVISILAWTTVDARTMGDFGLVDLVTPAAIGGLALIVAGFAWALARGARERVLGAYAIAFAVALHIGPVIAYGTLRLPWAWKHVGIIDYITRHGSVDPGIDLLAVYHNWPGFFAGSAVLQELAGAADSLGIATAAPIAIVIANVFALRFVLRVLTPDTRRVWFGIWLFSVVNWVGQDYFSPQALAFLLYLVLIGIVLRFYGRRSASGAPHERVPAGIFAIVLILMAGIGWNHQITPIMTTIALAALFVTRRTRGWYLPVTMLAVTGAWALLVAHGYTLASLDELLVVPTDTVDQNLEKSAHLRGSAIVVSWAGRALVVAGVLLAAAGAIRLLRRRGLDQSTLVLVGSPVLLLVATSFGGETLFRIVLFSAPFLCLLAAAIVFPGTPRSRGTGLDTFESPSRPTGARNSWGALAGVLALTVALTPTFLVAYYGNDRQYYFTADEVSTVRDFLLRAPTGSLVVEGNTNYSVRLVNYERFHYVSISAEPEDSRDSLLADPVATLARWTSDGKYPAGYVLITRAQKVASDAVGPMPAGAMQDIEDALRASPDFAVDVESEDAVVFRYVGGAR